MTKKLNVENCIAYNKCIKINPTLFKEFINDYLVLANNNYGYKEVSTNPSSNFYGLYAGTMVGYGKGYNWNEFRQKYQHLSNIDNVSQANYLKIVLAKENGHFEMHAIDFIFKYDVVLSTMLWSKKHYGDVLIDFLRIKFDDDTIDLLNEYIDFVIDHIDQIDEINQILTNMKIHEIREFELQKDINPKLMLKPGDK